MLQHPPWENNKTLSFTWTRDQLLWPESNFALPYYSLSGANTLLVQIPSILFIHPHTTFSLNISLLWNSSKSWILNKHPARSNAVGMHVARYVTMETPMIDDQNSSLIATVELQQEIGSAEALQDTHKREAICLHPTRLWKGIHSAQCPDSPYTHAHGREATRLPV